MAARTRLIRTAVAGLAGGGLLVGSAAAAAAPFAYVTNSGSNDVTPIEPLMRSPVG